jgi:hypothetical protein
MERGREREERGEMTERDIERERWSERKERGRLPERQREIPYVKIMKVR